MGRGECADASTLGLGVMPQGNKVLFLQQQGSVKEAYQQVHVSQHGGS